MEYNRIFSFHYGNNYFENIHKIQGKQLRWSYFFQKSYFVEQHGYLVAVLFQFHKIVFLKKAIPPELFPMDLYESFQNIYFYSNSEWIFIKFKYMRSNRPEVFCKKGILRNFTEFTGKYLCQSLFFNKVAGQDPYFLVNLQEHLFYRTNLGDCFWKLTNYME